MPLTIQPGSASFSSAVRLEAASLPDGFDVSFDAADGIIQPGPGAQAATATVSSSASLIGGTYTLVLAGQGVGVRSEHLLEVTVLEPRIETSAAPTSLGFDANTRSQNIGLSAVSLYGKTGAVDLDLLDAPEGLLYSFATQQLPAGSATTLLLTDTDQLRNGSYTLRVRAEVGLQQQYIPLTLTVNKPAEINPDQRRHAGEHRRYCGVRARKHGQQQLYQLYPGC